MVEVPLLLQKKTCTKCEVSKFVYEFHRGCSMCAECSSKKNAEYRRRTKGIPIYQNNPKLKPRTPLKYKIDRAA